MRDKLISWARTATYLAAGTLFVFLLLNLAAHVIFGIIRDRGSGDGDRNVFINSRSQEGRAVLEQFLSPAEVENSIRLLSSDPGFRSHPVLAFTEGLSRPGYRVGLESMRYQDSWSDEDVRRWLSEGNRHTYFFGGSTAFGHGVGNDQTVVSNLNQLREGRHLNFGVQAADSLREVDNLLHLLRLGYRPREVLFLDGLNDMVTFAASPYRPNEKARTQTWLPYRGDIPLVFGHPRNNNMLRALAFSLPVVQLLLHLRWQSRFQDFQHQPRRADLERLDWDILMYYYLKWPEFQPARATELSQEWIDYYARNIDFVKRLGDTFGFQAHFVFQPNGLAEAGHPLMRSFYSETPIFKLSDTFVRSVRAAIAANQLEMLDCSAALSSDLGTAYIDQTHYSPAGNRRLAQCIASGLEQ